MEQLKIVKVDVPSSVKVGEDYVILDCDYDLENTSSRGLVVKWFLNNYDLVYQWIYNTKPQAIEPAMKYIDLEYRASEEPTSMYRAMKLVEPNIDLTGNYTCQISTFEDEVSEKRSMTVYGEYGGEASLSHPPQGLLIRRSGETRPPPRMIDTESLTFSLEFHKPGLLIARGRA